MASRALPWSRTVALAVLLSAGSVEAQSIADTFRRTGPHEPLVVPFTAPATRTRNSYGGNVEVIVSGTGTSYGDRVNDAFFGVPSGVPVDYNGTGWVFDLPFYQLNLGWGDGFGLIGCEGEAHNLNNFITFIDTTGPVVPPAMPAYDPVGHRYHFVVSIDANAGPLSFGVSDCHFEDNTGAYHVEVFQLEPSSTPAPGSGVTPLVGVVVGTAAGRLGESVVVPVSLHVPERRVAALQTDVTFEAEMPIAANDNGRPVCAVNAGIDKPDSSFTFIPPGCAPGVDCSGVRAVIVAFDKIETIADGVTLFSCVVDVGPVEPRAYGLGCANARGSDEVGTAVALECAAGAVAVIPPNAAVVGSGSGRPNELVQIPVFLASAEGDVAAAQVDLHFGPRVSVVARANGRPDCRVDDSINKPGSQFSFQPPGCVAGVDCTGVRSLIVDLSDIANLDPIPDGSTLFRCAARISGDAAPARYPLGCSEALASDALGNRIDLSCVAGAVVVSRACPGDCDGNASVTVDELLYGVNTLLGTSPVGACYAFDVDRNSEVTIEELLRGIIAALNGC